MMIELRNDFHNSAVRLRVASLPTTLTDSQRRRARRELCGLRDYCCGEVRGPQSHNGHTLDVELAYGRNFNTPVYWRVSYRYPEEVE